MIFSPKDLPGSNKHSLSIYNYPRGILVFFFTLAFFLSSVEHNKAMKIVFTFFRAIKLFLCISKVSQHFCSFLIRGKVFYMRGLLTGQSSLGGAEVADTRQLTRCSR